jgi:histidine triad (HIT) family protein
MVPAETPPVDDCIFCRIVRRTAPAYVVYEDASTMAFLDLFPFTRGHLLVIPKRHGPRLTDLPFEDQSQLIQTLDRMCRRAERLTADYNVALNAGARAGQIVFHAHFHVIPRYGESNPFHPPTRVRISEPEAQALVGELSAP